MIEVQTIESSILESKRRDIDIFRADGKLEADGAAKVISVWDSTGARQNGGR